MDLNLFPVELLYVIYGELGNKDLQNLSYTCNRNRLICLDVYQKNILKYIRRDNFLSDFYDFINQHNSVLSQQFIIEELLKQPYKLFFECILYYTTGINTNRLKENIINSNVLYLSKDAWEHESGSTLNSLSFQYNRALFFVELYSVSKPINNNIAIHNSNGYQSFLFTMDYREMNKEIVSFLIDMLFEFIGRNKIPTLIFTNPNHKDISFPLFQFYRNYTNNSGHMLPKIDYKIEYIMDDIHLYCKIDKISPITNNIKEMSNKIIKDIKEISDLKLFCIDPFRDLLERLYH